MKKQILTRRARLFCLIGMFWCGINFAFMFTNMIRNGTSAFPGGAHDERGYFAMDHGRRYDFTALAYKISYWQGLTTCISIPLFLMGVFVLHATGDIKQIIEP